MLDKFCVIVIKGSDYFLILLCIFYALLTISQFSGNETYKAQKLNSKVLKVSTQYWGHVDKMRKRALQLFSLSCKTSEFIIIGKCLTFNRVCAITICVNQVMPWL